MSRNQPPLSIAVVAAEGLRQRCQTILAGAGGLRVRAGGLAGAPVLLRRHQPTVLVLDAVESPRRALEALPALRRLSPTTGVIVLGKDDATTELVLEAVRRGACGHVAERDLPRHLPHAVRTVATREPWLSRRLGAAIVAELRAARGASARRPRPKLRLIRGLRGDRP